MAIWTSRYSNKELVENKDKFGNAEISTGIHRRTAVLFAGTERIYAENGTGEVHRGVLPEAGRHWQ